MLILGWRRYVQRLAMLTLVCGNCGNPAAHTLQKVVTKFTVFFVPLFPLSTKHTLQCTWCGTESNVPPQHAGELLARAQSEQPAARTGSPWPGQPPRI
ncbi:hypothetical protein [Nocardia sp. NPDC049149]|uniref:hypothetical protein n=1 Tax=Nocardia sp. NPDC049149 TaxID=3364315 RepID=UPI00371FF6B4